MISIKLVKNWEMWGFFTIGVSFCGVYLNNCMVFTWGKKDFKTMSICRSIHTLLLSNALYVFKICVVNLLWTTANITLLQSWCNHFRLLRKSEHWIIWIISVSSRNWRNQFCERSAGVAYEVVISLFDGLIFYFRHAQLVMHHVLQNLQLTGYRVVFSLRMQEMPLMFHLG